MRITDFLVLNSDGEEIRADPHGNNVAFCCSNCGFPILAVALENQRGSDSVHPVACKGCSAQYFLDVREQVAKLYVHSV